MALTFDQAARISDRPAARETESPTDIAEHEVTYRKFVRAFAIGTCLLPLFFIFLLYWTT